MNYRALIAKAGLDAHERGVHVITRGLRDAGFEVIVAGLRASPDALAAMAVQEDVDLIGISSLAGGHRMFAAKLAAALQQRGADPVIVFGGVIPEQDDAELARQGVSAIFRPGTSMAVITQRVTALLEEHASVPTQERFTS